MRALRAVPRFAIVMTSLLAAAAFPQSALFVVDRIEVVGAATLSPAAVVALAGIQRGQRLFAVHVADHVRRLRTHPRIKVADIRVRPPDAVVIVIVERRPVMALRIGDRFVLLDEELFVVAVTRDPAGVPEVEDRTGRALSVGRVGARGSSEGARIALAALAAAPRGLRSDVAKISVTAGPDLSVILWTGLEIRAGGLWGLADRLAQVPGILQALAARGVAPATIDLRYAGSVVVMPAVEQFAGGDER
ncbi:MAG: FtsQ-type POTRA domain-containing protein [Chloroflexi bacterium]|nr:FtsQ-type POTRA domain-containing protein [Chloroflexota bacterium]